jgi:hypothetical protein
VSDPKRMEHAYGEKGIIDITAPQHVEVRIRRDGKVVWINVDGTCVMRTCQIKQLELVDERHDLSQNTD